eukprot:CAMPEP_0170203872 /NCGR_PEP_ID=MMETSP0116_2-20130129/1450_1 /TAXON_ID=400756 /ORGANISM="Durinskia baltica, Strain CSIRO CS-38" /LENGTH=1093 /DNA_ID=CAMNT_0010454203 /DNA_START=95 /DNA_END=3376 /DNA_ORIENTATION=+
MAESLDRSSELEAGDLEQTEQTVGEDDSENIEPKQTNRTIAKIEREESIMGGVMLRINQVQQGTDEAATWTRVVRHGDRKSTGTMISASFFRILPKTPVVAQACVNRWCMISFRVAVVSAILFMVLLSWGSMYIPLVLFTHDVCSKSVRTWKVAVEKQVGLIGRLAEDKMWNHYRGIFDVMTVTIERFVLNPPKNAVDALSGHILTVHHFGNGLEGEDTAATREALGYNAFEQLSYQWHTAFAGAKVADMNPWESEVFRLPRTDALGAVWTTGQCVGSMVEWDVIDHGGHDAVAHSHHVVSHIGYDAPAATTGNHTWMQEWELHPHSGNRARLLETRRVTPTAWHPYAVQKKISEEAENSSGGASSVPATRAWSEIFMYEGGTDIALAWTAPIAFCGDYSCFAGAVTASVKLESVSWDCHQHWLQLKQSCGAHADESNSGIFIINKFSRRFPEQQGMLIGASSMNVTLGQGLTYAIKSPHRLVRATAQAMLHRFGSLHNGTVEDPTKSLMSFRLIGSDAGNNMSDFLDCENGVPGGYATDCVRVGTRTLYLDLDMEMDTQWLLLVVMPSNCFRTDIYTVVLDAGGKLSNFTQSSKTKVLNVSIVGVSLLVGLVAASGLFGWFLGCLVNRPLQRLSVLMQNLGDLDFSDETGELDQLCSGHYSSIRDVAKLQQAFCTLARGTEAFARFVPETVVRNIVGGDQRSTRLHVARREVTIMFSVIQDATTLSEHVSQNDFNWILTRYFSVMTRIVEHFEGVVGEIMTEPPGLLVFWNTPKSVEQHSAKACAASLAQQRAVSALNEEYRRARLPEISVRIGLHTGDVLTGNIGSDMKMKFGCLGDPMNLASRLAGLCAVYGVGVLCSDSTHRGLPQCFFCRRLDLVRVKGREEPTEIFEVVAQGRTEEPKPAMLSDHCGSNHIGPDFESGKLHVSLRPVGLASYDNMPSTSEVVNVAMRLSTEALAKKSTTLFFPAARGPRCSPARGGFPGLAKQCTLPIDVMSRTTPVLAGACEQDIISEEMRAYVQKYEAALAAYQAARFAQAHSFARELLMDDPEDVAASMLSKRSASHLAPDGSVIGLDAEELAAWTGVSDVSKK